MKKLKELWPVAKWQNHQDKKAQIRLDLIYHRLKPETALEILERDPKALVIESLARSPDSAVALKVAEYEEATPSALRTLSVHRLGVVREAVARHPNTPIDVLTRLIAGADIEAAPVALEHPALPQEWLERGRRGPLAWVRAVASSPNLSEEMALEMVQNTDERVLVSLARNKAISNKVLESILERSSGWAEGGRYNLRAEIAKRPQLDPGMRQRLADDADSLVADIILEKTLEEIVETGAVVAVANQDLALFAQNPSPQIEARIQRALTFLESQAADGDELAAIAAWPIWISYAPLTALKLYPRISEARQALLGPEALTPLLNHPSEEIRQGAEKLAEQLKRSAANTSIG